MIYLLVCISAEAQNTSQNVIASDGDYSVSSSGSISWTIGETIGDTYIGTSNIVTKGFHQPYMVIMTSIPEVCSEGNVLAYPNPVVGNLQLDFSKMTRGYYFIEVYDVAGKLLNNSKVFVDSDSFQKSLDLSQLSKGNYLFKITNESSSLPRSFSITKQ